MLNWFQFSNEYVIYNNTQIYTTFYKVSNQILFNLVSLLTV